MNQPVAAIADPLLDTEATAEYLGVQAVTLQNWRIYGKGPSFLKLGSTRFARVRYRLSAIEAYLLEGSTASPPTTTEMPEPLCRRCGVWPVTLRDEGEATEKYAPDEMCEDCREDTQAHDYLAEQLARDD